MSTGAMAGEKAFDNESCKFGRYDLNPEELNVIEKQMIEDSKEVSEDGVVVVWIPSESIYANFVRTKEAEYFPEVKNLSQKYDRKQEIFALVDTREGKERVLHALTFMDYLPDAAEKQETGFYTVDSLVNLGNFTSDQFREYYEDKGIDLTKSISIETNFRIKKIASRYLGYLSSAELAYVTTYNEIMRRGAEVGSVAVFATVNNLQKRSLEGFGLEFEQLMGLEKFTTEEESSNPIAIIVNEKNANIFNCIGVILPELRLVKD